MIGREGGAVRGYIGQARPLRWRSSRLPGYKKRRQIELGQGFQILTGYRQRSKGAETV